MKLASCCVITMGMMAIASVDHAHAQPDTRPAIKVAVVPSIAVNVDSARVDALGQDLAEALASELEVEAVGGLEVRRQLPAEGLPAECLTTPACVADVAKRLGANQLLPDAAVRSKAQPAPALGKMTPEIPRHVTRPAMITAGIGVVGLGVGIGFGLAARSAYNDCDAPGACDSSERDAIRTKTILADAGFAVAIGGIVATTVLYMTSGKESRLVVEPTGGGVAVTAIGRF